VTAPVRWGILSTARINRRLIPAAHESGKAELVGVASRDQATAEEYARQWEIPRAYGSYEALLADEDIEAVYISLPNSLHVEWSIRALEAGRHVLCEKPMGKHAAAVEEAFDVADRAGLVLSEAFMYRCTDTTRRPGSCGNSSTTVRSASRESYGRASASPSSTPTTSGSGPRSRAGA
jgi:predicted dehydrogenase